jgi:hypothetical protein
MQLSTAAATRIERLRQVVAELQRDLGLHPLVYPRAAATPLRTGQHLDACHRIVSCTGANTDVCSSLQSDAQKAILASGVRELSPQMASWGIFELYRRQG